MAWPQKGTRKIHVAGIEFLWHYSGHCPLCSDAVFTIGVSGAPHVLYVDPFPWQFEIKPSAIAGAIRWALDNGWTPETGPTRAMSLNERSEFVWLPEGARHLSCRNPGD